MVKNVAFCAMRIAPIILSCSVIMPCYLSEDEFPPLPLADTPAFLRSLKTRISSPLPLSCSLRVSTACFFCSSSTVVFLKILIIFFLYILNLDATTHKAIADKNQNPLI